MLGSNTNSYFQKTLSDKNRLGILDDVESIPQLEEGIERVCKELQSLLNTSIIIVSFYNEKYEYIKNLKGLKPSNLPHVSIEKSFAQHVPESKNLNLSPIKVNTDFYNIPLVLENSSKSYLGASLKVGNCTIGTLSALESRPKDWSEKEIVCFEMAASALNTEIELRHKILQSQKQFAEAQDSIRKRDEFITVASHELKAPIASLKWQMHIAEKMAARADSPAENKEFIHDLTKNSNRQIERIKKLVDDMLDSSRITRGKLIVEMKDIDVVSVVKDTINNFRNELDELQIDIKLSLPETLIAVCDPSRLDQVLTNLMSNAINYGNKTPITIILEDLKDKFYLRVHDNGKGINKDDQQRIFIQFERATTSNEVKGLGLGLFITRQIINQHGGRISVESDPKEGTTFTVELPKNPPDLEFDRNLWSYQL